MCWPRRVARLCGVLIAFFIITVTVFVAGCKGQTTEGSAVETVTVYIDSGAKQCYFSGHPLAKTEQRLQAAGVTVTESACGVLTGVMFPAVCGGHTEKINLHVIQASHLPLAERAGFKPVSSLQQGQQPGFKQIACDKRGVNLSPDV
ncbi:hypothetical protein [Halioxenophilus aromaticivorans]|uniref:hypothetical protein n=1 Tax=Halioxenophilus aromaticivorans TaxID=1306992 RepID=UPI0031E73EC6